MVVLALGDLVIVGLFRYWYGKLTFSAYLVQPTNKYVIRICFNLETKVRKTRLHWQRKVNCTSCPINHRNSGTTKHRFRPAIMYVINLYHWNCMININKIVHIVIYSWLSFGRKIAMCSLVVVVVSHGKVQTRSKMLKRKREKITFVVFFCCHYRNSCNCCNFSGQRACYSDSNYQ